MGVSVFSPFSCWQLLPLQVHHLHQSEGAEWGLLAQGIWIPPPGPLLQHLVHISGEAAQLCGGEVPKLWTNKDLSTWYLSEVQLSHRDYSVMLLTLFWHNLRFCFPEHYKKSSERKQNRPNRSTVISRVSLEAVISEVFIYKRHYTQIWYQELCGTVMFSHLQAYWPKESALIPAVWLQHYANGNTKTHLSHFSYLFHSSTRFIIIPLPQEELTREALSDR